jgi:dipeptidyl aminopeptidase/acylaminoacyl peptidase
MVPLFEKAGVPVRLVVIEGAGHGFTPKQRAEQMAPAAMEWLEKHLKKR